MRTTWWRSGDWSALCDVCGFKFKASELRTRWDGLKVCSRDWELRHPQELIRPITENNKLPWTRPEGTDNDQAVCTVTGRQGIAGYAVADCAITEFDLGYRDTPTFV